MFITLAVTLAAAERPRRKFDEIFAFHRSALYICAIPAMNET
jgi:hypothetical protein